MLFGFLLHTLSFAILQFGAIWLSIQKLNLAQVVTQISTNEMLFSFAIVLFFVFAMLKFIKKINLIKYFFYIILLVGIKSTFITFFPNFTFGYKFITSSDLDKSSAGKSTSAFG